MNRRTALCCTQTSHVIIQTSQIVVIIMICHSHSLPLCFVIYSIHVLDFKQPDAIHWLLSLTLKISLKLQNHLESWKTVIQEKFSEHNERCEVTELFDLLCLKRSCPPLPLRAHHQLQLPLLTLLPPYFFMAGSLLFTWFIQASLSSSLSSPVSETAQDPATTYCPPSCSVTNSRPSFITLIIVTSLDMFYLCPSCL